MARFKFHGTLRDLVPAGELSIDGNRSVGRALSTIADQNNGLKEALYVDSSGTLHEYFVVVLNGEQVEFLDDGLDTVLTEEDVVQVFPPVSGG